MTELFASFDLRPVSCASIAHVHRARLRDGRKVAVKIRRPGIVSKIDNDFRILYFWARRLSALPFMRTVPLISLIAEIGEAVKLQTSFEQEAENNRRFQEHFAGIEHIRFPRLVDELCVDSVVTMEFFDGLKKVTETEFTVSERRVAALAGLRALYKMIFTDGFVHADLHPGNVFLREWGEVVILDTGLVARLTDDDLQDFVDFFFGLINNDGKVCARIVCGTAVYFTKRYDKERFESAIVELVAEYSALKSHEFEITSFVYRLIKTQREFGICGSTKFIMTILSMVVFDGICKELYPNCNFQAEAQGFLITARYRRRSARRADQLNASNFSGQRYGPPEDGSEAGRFGLVVPGSRG
jgi:ubiquinone biosynthesis protein